MEWLFLNFVGSDDRDFISHSVFYCIYGLLDVMLLLLIPNITVLYVVLIAALHLLLFGLAWLQSNTGITGGMVPYMSLK